MRASSSFSPLEPQTAGAGLLTAAPRSLETRRPLHSRAYWPVDPSWRAWPPHPGAVPAPCLAPGVSPAPLPPPTAATPGHSGPRPIGRPGSICPYLARLLQAASTPSPAPAGPSLSLRLFEVWLWGPGGRRFKRTFWLSHFFNGSRAVSQRWPAAAEAAPGLRGHRPPPGCFNGFRGKKLGWPLAVDHLGTHLDPSALPPPLPEPGAWEVCPGFLSAFFPTLFSGWAGEEGGRLPLPVLLCVHAEVHLVPWGILERSSLGKQKWFAGCWLIFRKVKLNLTKLPVPHL